MTQLAADTTALVAIDLQEGILRIPLAPHTGADIVARTDRLAKRFRERKSVVALTNVTWAGDFADALKQSVDRPMARLEDGLPADFAVLSKELEVAASDIKITKRQWSAFHGTELDLQFRRRGIKTIVLTGVATNMGVESTARSAWELGYELIFVEDAITSVAAEMHAFAANAIFPLLGRVRTTAQLMEMLG